MEKIGFEITKCLFSTNFATSSQIKEVEIWYSLSTYKKLGNTKWTRL